DLKGGGNVEKYGRVDYMWGGMDYVVMYVNGEGGEDRMKNVKGVWYVGKMEGWYGKEMKREYGRKTMDKRRF
uniref:DUF2129 domain-containing protein n=1 Tax=Paenibacillus xylanexedens TaxID=528191 RepID=UPI0011A43BB4